MYGRPKDDEKILAEQAEILEALAVETQHGEYKWRYASCHSEDLLEHES